VFDEAPDEPTIGGFDGLVHERSLHRTGASRLALGRIAVRSRITTEEQDFEYAVLHLGDHNILGGIRPYGAPARHLAVETALKQTFSRADLTELVRQIERLFDGHTFTMRTLFHDPQAAILDRLLEDKARAVEEQYEAIYDQAAPLMRFLQSLEQQAPPAFKTAAQYTLMARLRRQLEAGRELDLVEVRGLLEEAHATSVPLDPVVLGLALQNTLETQLAALREEPDDEALLEHIAAVAAFVASSPWKMELANAQNHVWRLAQDLMTKWGKDERADLLAHIARDLGLKIQR
jgi:hypothetical protein